MHYLERLFTTQTRNRETSVIFHNKICDKKNNRRMFSIVKKVKNII